MVDKPTDVVNVIVPWAQLIEDIDQICGWVRETYPLVTAVWGPPLNGTIIAAICAKRWGFDFITDETPAPLQTGNKLVLVIDDIIDTGKTLGDALNLVATDHMRDRHPFLVTALYRGWHRIWPEFHIDKHVHDVQGEEDWIVFPWETGDDQVLRIKGDDDEVARARD